jgi:hypothetical protein
MTALISTPPDSARHLSTTDRRLLPGSAIVRTGLPPVGLVRPAGRTTRRIVLPRQVAWVKTCPIGKHKLHQYQLRNSSGSLPPLESWGAAVALAGVPAGRQAGGMNAAQVRRSSRLPSQLVDEAPAIGRLPRSNCSIMVPVNPRANWTRLWQPDR